MLDEVESECVFISGKFRKLFFLFRCFFLIEMFPSCSNNDYLAVITREAPFLVGPKRRPLLKRPTEDPVEEKIRRYEAKRSCIASRGDTVNDE